MFSLGSEDISELRASFCRLREVLGRIDALSLTRGAFDAAARSAAVEASSLSDIYKV